MNLIHALCHHHLLKVNKHTTIPILYSTDESITATLTVIPGVQVPESTGFVQACVMLDAEPAGEVTITLETIDGLAQGALFICKITIVITSMN